MFQGFIVPSNSLQGLEALEKIGLEFFIPNKNSEALAYFLQRQEFLVALY